MTSRALTLSACLLAACSFPLAAQATDSNTPAQPQQYVGLMAHWLHTDSDRNVKPNATGLGAFYGYRLTDHFWWESSLDYFKLPTGISGLGDYSQTYLMTGLAYDFGDRKGLTPYVIAQIGAIRHTVKPSADDDTDMGASAGAGLLSAPLFGSALRLRGELRYVLDTFDGDRGTDSVNNGPFGDWRLSLGVEFPLGARHVTHETPVVATVAAPPAAPAAQPAPAPQPKVVLDSDGDGVPDSRDACPDTPRGAKVDARGCLIANQSIVLRDILFELGSATLTQSSQDNLAGLAKSLNAQPTLQVEVAGYTDSTGRAAINTRLSQQRADAVRAFLVQQGVNAQRLTAKGYGPTHPVASNKTVSGRALNRRVELHLSGATP